MENDYITQKVTSSLVVKVMKMDGEVGARPQRVRGLVEVVFHFKKENAEEQRKYLMSEVFCCANNVCGVYFVIIKDYISYLKYHYFISKIKDDETFLKATLPQNLAK